MNQRFIDWACLKGRSWALEQADTKRICHYKAEKRCNAECTGFPDQEWRDEYVDRRLV